MKERQLKFNAYIPSLKLLIDKVCIYSSGDIGIAYDDFNKYLKTLNPNTAFIPIDDKNLQRAYPVYYIDSEDNCIYLRHGDDTMDDNVLSIMSGDDWIQVDSKDVTILQCTPMKDKNGKEIWEGMIVKVDAPPLDFKMKHPVTGEEMPSGDGIKGLYVVSWSDELCGFTLDACDGSRIAYGLYDTDTDFEVIDYKFFRPELITARQQNGTK